MSFFFQWYRRHDRKKPIKKTGLKIGHRQAFGRFGNPRLRYVQCPLPALSPTTRHPKTKGRPRRRLPLHSKASSVSRIQQEKVPPDPEPVPEPLGGSLPSSSRSQQKIRRAPEASASNLPMLPHELCSGLFVFFPGGCIDGINEDILIQRHSTFHARHPGQNVPNPKKHRTVSGTRYAPMQDFPQASPLSALQQPS
jgi:hypothetical protein